MKLPRRLKVISDLIEDDATVFDVGCDHGNLGIYLHVYKKCKVSLSDVNSKVLDFTRKNLIKHNLNNAIQLVKSDGLTELNINKEDYVVIAGMGSFLAGKIIINALEKAPDNIIIQTNNEPYHLRRMLTSNGYLIFNEVFIKEKNKNYTVIHFKKGKAKYTKKSLLYGPVLIKDKLFLNEMIRVKKNLLKALPKNKLFDKLKIKFEIYELKKKLLKL